MSLVLKSLPVHLSQKVDLDTDIEVRFLFDILTESINTKNVMLLNLNTQQGEEIAVEYKDKLLKILPARRLAPLTHYQVELVGGADGCIRDITERPLLQSYKFEFFTGNETRMARPMLTSPTDLSEITGDVKFTWLPVEKADHYELEISRSNTFDVLVWPQENTALVFETQVTPDIDYRKGVTYYARIRAVNIQGIKSAYSDPIRYYYNGTDEVEPEVKNSPVVEGEATKPAEIDTLKDFFQNEIDNEVKPLTMKLKPKDGTLMVKDISRIVIEFSEDVNPDSISADTVYIVSEKN